VPDKPFRLGLRAEQQTETKGMEDAPCESMHEVEGEVEIASRRHKGLADGRQDSVCNQQDKRKIGSSATKSRAGFNQYIYHRSHHGRPIRVFTGTSRYSRTRRLAF
jgi:hypothetical protein